MRLKAPRLGETLAGLGAVAVLYSLLTGWDGVGVLNILLVLCAGLALFVVFAEMTQRGSSLSLAGSAVGVTLALITAIWTLAAAQLAPVGLAGIVCILVGFFVGLRDEGTSFFPGAEWSPGDPN
ncbi:MAG: hypothetical protein QOG62_2342 [Thermoleophilaceae bacterium]|jgi:ABC-type proline/glycine betaine transport system permease subunit|nr:hypothetical protein [Thermoleophilaceae bacterium]